MNFKKKQNQKIQTKSKRKKIFLKTYMHFLMAEKEFSIFAIKIESRGFSDKVSDHSNLKILTPKQILQKLPTALSQVKGGTTSETLLNEIRQIIYSLY